MSKKMCENDEFRKQLTEQMDAKQEFRAWIIINEFLNTSKFSEITHYLLVAAGMRGIRLNVFTNAEVMIGAPLPEEKPDFVLFWDKDILLAQYLESLGIPVFNSSQAIAVCDDKRLTYLALADSGIPMPKTVIAPFTYDNIGYNNFEFLKKVEEEIDYPIVVKEAFGSFGMQVYLVQNHDEMVRKLQEISPKPVVFQEFLAEFQGTDVRLQVVGDEVVASMLRYSVNGDFRANITIGGRMQKYTPTREQCEMAILATKKLGLDFAGVDLLFGPDERPVLCEVNSNAHFKTIFDCTGINVADKIICYVRGVMRDKVRKKQSDSV